MLLDHSSSLSGHIKILFLAVAVLVVLDQASPDGWTRKCGYGTGNCRKHCKKSEKKKEKCGLRKLCCIPIKHKSSKLVRKEETAYRVMSHHDKDAPTAEVSENPNQEYASMSGTVVPCRVIRATEAVDTEAKPVSRELGWADGPKL
ncbi:beta-defensin 115 [Bos taurus]|nr:beta-defensin 115 [Bos taurus]